MQNKKLSVTSGLRARFLAAVVHLSLFSGKSRSLRGKIQGALRLEHVGYGLAVSGAVLALVSFLGAVFIPVATVALIYWEVLALLGAILLIIGIVVHAAE